MQRSSHFWIATVAAVVTTTAVAAAGLSKPSDTKVKFAAIGPAGLKFEGTTNELDLADDGGNVVVTVRLGSLNTGIDIRDRHMKEKYLQVDKYPDAKLTVARSALKVPAAGEKVTADAPATLKLHGQTMPTTVHYEAKGEGSTLDVNGKMRVNMKDAGIDVPVYLGITVKPDVDVDVHFKVAGS